MHVHQMLFSMAVLLCATSALSHDKARAQLPHIRGHLLVKADPTQLAPLDDFAKLVGAERTNSFTLVPGLDLYEFDASRSVEEVRQLFLSNSRVIYAEPDYIYRIELPKDIPNDVEFAKQWALENNGQTGGMVDADINASRMWDIQKGSSDVVIATIDTGLDYTHPDLSDNSWVNSNEIPNNGKDDDNNGYVDDIHGINAILNSGDPMDDNVHGTHVAGTIGAKGNNNLGVVGVAQNVKIASCKFLSRSGSGGISDALKCMDYFAALKSRAVNPVNIVATNNSWGGGGASQAFLDAVKAHERLGILFVAAAGNSSENNDSVDRYPSNYAVANVISVAATDHKDILATFSSYGKKTVHVAAPGVKILSTVLNRSYGELSGTSMATPHVSGLVAIIASQYPDYDYKKIKNLIMSSGQALPSTKNTTISGRRIRGADSNGVGALTCLNQLLTRRIKPETATQRVSVGTAVFLSATGINCSDTLSSLKVYDQNGVQLVLKDDGQNGDIIANDGILSLNWVPTTAGTYVLDFGNQDTVTVTVTGGSTPPGSGGIYQIIESIGYEYENFQGNALSAGDDTVHWVKIPFPIHFANDPNGFRDLYISSNGTISFTSSTETSATNTRLPVSSKSTLIAPFWDDLMPDNTATGSDIYAIILGEAPHRRLVIEWWKFRHYGSTPAQGTFQAVFYEDSSDIRVNYLSTNFNNSQFNAGQSATVGVQNAADQAVQYSYNQAKIPSRKSILYRVE